MNTKFIKRGIAVAILTMSIIVPAQTIIATEAFEKVTVSTKQKEETNKNKVLNISEKLREQKSGEKKTLILSEKEIRLNEKLLNYIFVVTENKEAFVYAEPDEESNWVGKAYENSPVDVLDIKGEWSLIESGNVKGYVKTETLIKGAASEMHAKRILKNAYPQKDMFRLNNKELKAAFMCAETQEEEQVRLAKEAEERRIAEEKARKQKQQALVNFAKRFIGNPYVYGGTSLTNGTDCSGFVGSVYRNFGVSLPRTSSGMRSAGRGVSVSDMQPGDILCYSGHVGIYIGGGKIVNAINESKGIGISNAYYAPILTVRRIF